MENTTADMLVNFRANRDLMLPFDQICKLAGRTRTDTLIALIEDYIIKIGPRIAQRIEDRTALTEALAQSILNGDKMFAGTAIS